MARELVLESIMKRLLLTTIVGLGFALGSPEATAQTISDRIYDVSREPGTPVIIGVLGEPIRLSIDEFTKRADLVLEARLSRLESYINAADTAVVTEFEIQPIQILSGAVPVEAPLVLFTNGGEVVRDGVTVREIIHDREELKERTVYLLFLRHWGPRPSGYAILNVGVFERSNHEARPLARQGNNLFREFSKTYGEVVAQVKKAAHER
jgi:hypothetical protein